MIFLKKPPIINNLSYKAEWNRQCCLCTLLLCIAVCAHAQQFTLNADLRFENYNAANKFSIEFVHSIAADSKGYIWVGANGVNRFDGDRFVQYHKFDKPENGLLDNYVESLVEDNYGRLWVGTVLGLCYYNKPTDTFISLNINDKQKIRYAFALTLYNNKLWFISNYGLSYIDLKNLKVYTTSLTKAITSITIFPVGDKNLLVSSVEGAFIYHIQENTWEKMQLSPGIVISSVARVGGKLWLGTKAGVWQFSSNNDSMHQLKATEQYDVNAMAATPAITGDSILWIGTDNDGLIAYNLQQERMTYAYTHIASNHSSLQANEVTSLCVDKNNLLWIGTNTGLSLFNYNNQAFKIQLLPDVRILKIVQDKYNKQIVWLATENKGLIKLNWDTKAIIRTYNPLAKGVHAKNKVPVLLDIAQIDNNYWLLNTRGNLVLWNEQNGATTVLDNALIIPPNKRSVYIHYLIPAGKDSFYAASTVGLFLCDIKRKKNYPVIQRNDTLMNSPDDIIRGVYNKGNLWLATANGLLQYNIATGEQKRYYLDKVTTVTNRNWLRDVAVDNNGYVIAAGMDGIGVINIKTGRLHFYNDFNTVKNPECFSLKITDNIISINSDAGLILFNLYTSKSIVTLHDYNEAITTTPFGVINGDVVNEYRNSYAYFKPAELISHPVPSAPVIEKVTINDSSIHFPANHAAILLKHNQNIISFHFTAFEYTNPAKVHFRYKLGGLDKAWHFSNSNVRTANYIQVPPGKYTFALQAGNSENEWNSTPASFTFEIKPPFWSTWWFILLIICLFIGSVAGIAIYRVKKIRQEEATKTEHQRELLELELKTMRSQMNPHFIFNSLNSIQKYIWENRQEDTAEYLNKFSRLMRMTLDNSMQKWITLEQELNALTLYIELEHRRSNNKFNYQIQVSDCLDVTTILVPPLILQPYVENAIWHGLLPKDDCGDLRIAVMPGTKEDIACIIEDNGIGRSANGNDTAKNESKRTSYGMQLTHQRIMMTESNGQHGGVVVEDLKQDNNTASGTRVTIHLPLNSFIKI